MRMNLNYPTFPDLTEPDGFLTSDRACQALWYFYTLAEQNRLSVGRGPESQIILEGQQWMDKRYEQIATSVALMYGLNSPDDWQNYWPLIERTAKNLGYGTPAMEYRGRPRIIIH